jgi:hypothetical protein
MIELRTVIEDNGCGIVSVTAYRRDTKSTEEEQRKALEFKKQMMIALAQMDPLILQQSNHEQAHDE